jgi:hypothetical protein
VLVVRDGPTHGGATVYTSALAGRRFEAGRFVPAGHIGGDVLVAEAGFRLTVLGLDPSVRVSAQRGPFECILVDDFFSTV